MKMRNSILFGVLVAMAVPGVASAQSQREMRHDRREIRQDRRELRQDRREMRRDQRSAYVAPYGSWTYRTINPGYQLRPGFYGQRYIVNDYGRYQVRQPARFQHWVRYGNDLVLVNTRNGRVLQVLRNRY
jgi:Ni/Co efflux regulator RcnB